MANSRLAIPPQPNGLPMNHGHRYPAPPNQQVQQVGQRPPKQRRRQDKREKKSGRRRSNSRYSNKNIPADYQEEKPMSFVELTDFNEETKSVLSGRASIARSVVSKADTLVFDELMDLNINATPKYQ